MIFARSTFPRAACATAFALGCLAAFQTTTSAASSSASTTTSVLSSSAQEPLRYVRVKDGGAKLTNLADKDGVTLATLPARTLLAVHADDKGWLSVEPPQGVEVWVFGQYLNATDEAGVAEVTATSVRMRPKPSTGNDSYALGQKLDRGDRVRIVERKDPQKALQDDWVKVVAPAGTRAWIHVGDTVALEANADPKSEWNAAQKHMQSARPVVALPKSTDASAARATDAAAAKEVGKDTASGSAQQAAQQNAPATGAGSGSDTSFAAAEKLYNGAKASPDGANWGAVKTAYKSYLDKNPSGPSAAQARQRLTEAEVREEIARIQSDRQLAVAERSAQLAVAEQKLRDASLSQDPLWGRFQARGWLERDTTVSSKEPPRWVLTWAGKQVAEVVSGNGRYDLSLYERHEIGVRGVMQRAATGDAGTTGARPMRVEATRIEVLSGRGD